MIAAIALTENGFPVRCTVAGSALLIPGAAGDLVDADGEPEIAGPVLYDGLPHRLLPSLHQQLMRTRRFPSRARGERLPSAQRTRPSPATLSAPTTTSAVRSPPDH